ncbi:MAG: Gfo/Idh/MocA family protein [Thomasclavelia sp.]|uniref:Gfo/Idh/MocA family protein n=1 Tax=Thomasclavelia sp. TaxID=3025757 RepID=UPI0039A0FA04
MINWGVIGAGNIARRFCKALSNDKRANLEAVSCRTLEKAEAFKQLYPCNKAYGSFQEVLDDPVIDAVYIALPHFYHYEWIKKSILAHKKVLVEKPAVINCKQIQEIKELARKEKILVMEAMKTRFLPGYKEAKNLLLDQKVIGEIKKIETSFCSEHLEYDPNSYLFDLKQGGCLWDLGIYNISYLDDYFNFEISGLNVTSKYHDCGVDSYVFAEIEFKDQVGIVECAMDRKKENQVVFTGSHGKMIVKPLHRPLDIQIILSNGQIINKHIEYEYDDFYSEIAHFNDLIESNKVESKIMSLDNSVNCAKILDAIREKM